MQSLLVVPLATVHKARGRRMCVTIMVGGSGAGGARTTRVLNARGPGECCQKTRAALEMTKRMMRIRSSVR